jgi:hypothetical protein
VGRAESEINCAIRNKGDSREEAHDSRVKEEEDEDAKGIDHQEQD